MGDTTRDFSRWEFACRCGCGFKDPHPLLVAGLQELRDRLGASIAVNSGCRCQAHNRTAGGSAGSYHLPDLAGWGRAADITADAPLEEIYAAALSVPQFYRGGIGVYFDDGGPRVHVDVRPEGRARWAQLHRKQAALLDVLAASAAR